MKAMGSNAYTPKSFPRAESLHGGRVESSFGDENHDFMLQTLQRITKGGI